jgi:membrane protease YdiL (CAAX protease family)
MFRGRFPVHWYAALLIPPILILTALPCLTVFVSPNFAPNRFLMGALFGIPAGLLEEIGWMGFVFAKMRSQSNALAPGILLGLFWSIWHLPVIDFLGTTTPHGPYWFSLFLAFTVAMTAMRVLICWIYTNTNSVFMAQLMHVSSTGSIVIFSAPRVTATQEVMWYGLYGASLWLVVAIIVKSYGKRLTRQIALIDLWSWAARNLMSVCFCASVVGCLPRMDGESSSFLAGRYGCIAKYRWMPADEVVLILAVRHQRKGGFNEVRRLESACRRAAGRERPKGVEKSSWRTAAPGQIRPVAPAILTSD